MSSGIAAEAYAARLQECNQLEDNIKGTNEALADAPETVNRIISVSPPFQQRQVRLQLASVLKGVVSQRLIPRSDGKGRAAACEIMVLVVNPEVSGKPEMARAPTMPQIAVSGMVRNNPPPSVHLLKPVR